MTYSIYSNNIMRNLLYNYLPCESHMTQPIHIIFNKRQSHDTHLDPLVSDLLTEFPSTSANPSSDVISSDVLRLRPFFRSKVPEGENIIL